jgi:hypothetical protein
VALREVDLQFRAVAIEQRPAELFVECDVDGGTGLAAAG